MSQITGKSSLSEILDTIDLGPTGSVQMMFAKLQLAQSEICKNQAESYMKQIEDIQEEQELCAKMIEEARNCQQMGEDGKGVGQKASAGRRPPARTATPCRRSWSIS